MGVAESFGVKYVEAVSSNKIDSINSEFWLSSVNTTKSKISNANNFGKTD